MARRFSESEARRLSLPGRVSREILSGATGGAASVTVRIVELAPQKPGEPKRGPHVHHGFEECIVVLEGEGLTETDGGPVPVKAGDTLLVPSGERHVTHNTGSGVLKLLCFFPTADVAAGTREFKDWEDRGAP